MVASVWGNGTPQEAFEVPPDSIISEQSGNYAILTSDAHKVVDYIGAGGHTLTLPDATLAGNGFTLHLRNSGGAAITIAPATGADTVNGAASFSLVPTATIQLMVKSTDFGILLAKNTGATAASTAFTPAGNIAATNVQAAIQELDGEKAAVAGNAAQVFRVNTAVGATDAVPLAQAQAAFMQPASLPSQQYTAFTTTGTSTAFALTPSIVQTAYTAGMRFRVKFHLTAGAAPTINVSGLGAKALKLYNSDGVKVVPDALTTLYADMLTDIEYDGVDFVVLDRLPPLEKTINSGVLLVDNVQNLAHGLGRLPRNVTYMLNVVTPCGGWLAGDKIYLFPWETGISNMLLFIGADTTHFIVSNRSTTFNIQNKTTSAATAEPVGNFNVHVIYS